MRQGLDKYSYRNGTVIKHKKDDFRVPELRFPNFRIRDFEPQEYSIRVPDGQEWIIEMINNILIEVLSSMAEQERLTIRKRQRQGIDAAKAKGKHLGRPFIQKPNNYEQIMELWYAKKITTIEASRRLGVSKTTFYQMLKRNEAKCAKRSGHFHA